MTERFEFTDSIKKPLIYAIIAGVVGMVLAFFLYPENHHSRFWTNLLVNAYFFTGIGIFGIFFIAANQLGYSGWITVVKRVMLSLSGFVKVGAVFVLIIVGGVFLHYHNLYDHWVTPEGRATLGSTKLAFLNPPMWAFRVVLYYVLWLTVGPIFIKAVTRKDIDNKSVYKKSKLLAALWIVIFAVSESFISWDLIMSTDPHWYSTLFGWYNFASYGCAAFAFTILLVIFLKSKGYLAQVNENHVHDLGKFMFGFSIFWTYLWFSQFMLQWYANLPEDTMYWVKRFNVPTFKFTTFLALAINFVFPLLVILKRGNKRNFKVIGFAAALIIVGHYIDFYNMVMYEPNNPASHEHAEGKKEASLVTTTALYAENKEATTATPADAPVATEAVDASKETEVVKSSEEAKSEVKEAKKEGEGAEEMEEEEAPKTYAGFGLVEFLIFGGFIGAFLFMFFLELATDDLINPNDPYLKESLRHHVEYA